jgi:hypothetical protein
MFLDELSDEGAQLFAFQFVRECACNETGKPAGTYATTYRHSEGTGDTDGDFLSSLGHDEFIP